MSQHSLKRIISLILNDADYRERFNHDRAACLSGAQLTDSEREALLTLDVKELLSTTKDVADVLGPAASIF